MARLKITTKTLIPSLWPKLEVLFGANGACGGCWCMYWRKEEDESWDELKGKPAKARFKKLVSGAKAHGVLAFVDDVPVGWCSYDRRTDFSKLNRARTFKCDDADQVWSIPCFYVKAGFRGKGVASALLKHALADLKKFEAKIAEGYPIKPNADGQLSPAAFAWTGTQAMFNDAGFSLAGDPKAGKLRMRKSL